MNATTVKPRAYILDACCGSRMFYPVKDREDVIFMDIRDEDYRISWEDKEREVSVRPDVVGDFRSMPFPDSSFKMVVFDPPHLFHGSGIMSIKYGKLDRASWKEDLRQGFMECMRVLEPCGVLLFKWSDADVSYSEVRPLFPCEPLIVQYVGGGRTTRWTVFTKPRYDYPLEALE